MLHLFGAHQKPLVSSLWASPKNFLLHLLETHQSLLLHLLEAQRLYGNNLHDINKTQNRCEKSKLVASHPNERMSNCANSRLCEYANDYRVYHVLLPREVYNAIIHLIFTVPTSPLYNYITPKKRNFLMGWFSNGRRAQAQCVDIALLTARVCIRHPNRGLRAAMEQVDTVFWNLPSDHVFESVPFSCRQTPLNYTYALHVRFRLP